MFYIGCVCVCVHVTGLTRQGDECYIGLCICICTCYTTDMTKTLGLHRLVRVYVHVIGQRGEGDIECVCVYLHVIGLTRQRDEGYIGCVCVYVHVIGVTRQRDEDDIGCLCVYVHVTGLTRQGDECYIHVYVSVYML